MPEEKEILEALQKAEQALLHADDQLEEIGHSHRHWARREIQETQQTLKNLERGIKNATNPKPS